jgi:hypothetical protein
MSGRADSCTAMLVDYDEDLLAPLGGEGAREFALM